MAKDEECQPVNATNEDNPSSSFMKNCLVIVFGFVLIVLAFAVPIAMIVIGSLSFGDCTVEPMIPYFLLISGITTVIFFPITIFCAVCTKWRNGQDSSTKFCFKCYNGMFLGCVSVFALAWFICGNVWVYRIRDIEFLDENSPIYCNELSYRFSFWVIIATYICAVLSCCISAFVKRPTYDSLN